MGSFKLRVTAPCSQSWADMPGSDRARFCARCALTVHDLSAMTAGAARRLIAETDGRVCVRFTARPDGTVVCRRRGRWIRRAARALGLAALAVAFWTGVVLVQRPWRALARWAFDIPPNVPQPTTRAHDPRDDSPFGADYLRKLREEVMRSYGTGGQTTMGTPSISFGAPLWLPSEYDPRRHRRRK